MWTWIPGISVVGAVLAGGAAFALSCRLAAIPLGEALDLVVPGVVLGQAIGRLGCLAAGCCYGEETDSWLGVYLPDSHGEWANRYPTQLMSIGVDLLILGILLVAERRWTRRRPEMLAALYFTLFAVKRFLMQYPRGGDMILWGGLTDIQVYSLCMLAFVVWRWAPKERRSAPVAA